MTIREDRPPNKKGYTTHWDGKKWVYLINTYELEE